MEKEKKEGVKGREGKGKRRGRGSKGRGSKGKKRKVRVVKEGKEEKRMAKTFSFGAKERWSPWSWDKVPWPVRFTAAGPGGQRGSA